MDVHIIYLIFAGDSLLHMSAASKNESAGLFLIDRGAQVNHTNNNGESPLHIASKNGLVQLVDKLLKRYIVDVVKGNQHIYSNYS